MAMYRVLRRLSKGDRTIEPGTFTQLEWLEERWIDRLIMRGSVGRVAPPPLAILPGWSTRSRKIKEVLGLEDAEQFLEADNATIAEKMEVQERTVTKWKEEILGWLKADPIEQAG